MKRFAFGLIFAAAFTPALAHGIELMIHEVFVGPPAEGSESGLSPDQRAQYVVVRLLESSVPSMSDSDIFLRLEDANGVVLGRFGSFTENLSNAGLPDCEFPDCPGMIIGTQAADDLLAFSFDQLVDGQPSRAALPPSGARICLVEGVFGFDTEVFDCLAWGNFDCTRSGDCAIPNGLRADDVDGHGDCDPDFGAPAAPGGLEFGFVLARDTGQPFHCADTDHSTQYILASPHPENNAEEDENVDDDSDGLINVFDCDDASQAYLWSIADARNLRISNTPTTTLHFSLAATSGTGVTYDVARGSLAELSGFTDATALACNSSATSLQDFDSPSGGFYYLIRARSSPACGGAGTFGVVLPSVCP